MHSVDSEDFATKDLAAAKRVAAACEKAGVDRLRVNVLRAATTPEWREPLANPCRLGCTAKFNPSLSRTSYARSCMRLKRPRTTSTTTSGDAVVTYPELHVAFARVPGLRRRRFWSRGCPRPSNGPYGNGDGATPHGDIQAPSANDPALPATGSRCVDAHPTVE